MAAEEIKLGDVDPVDEFCVISIFDEAAAYLSDAHHIKLNSDQKLQFYAYFKQATLGPCDKPQPGLFEMVERAKWKAWKALGKMSKDEAVTQYVALLDKIAPQWKEELGDMEDEDEEERQKRRAQAGEKAGNDGLDIAPAVSRPVHEADSGPVTADLCHFAAEGDLKQLQALLAAGHSADVHERAAPVGAAAGCGQGERGGGGHAAADGEGERGAGGRAGTAGRGRYDSVALRVCMRARGLCGEIDRRRRRSEYCQ